MQAGDVVAGLVGGDKLGLDLIEGQGRGVDQAGAGRAMGQDFRRHDRAGVKTDRRPGQQIAPAQGYQIGRAGAGANKMHGHGFRHIH